MRFVASPVCGRLRLLAGMVRANRPWRLLLGLSSVLAVTLATSTLAFTQDTVWKMANALSPLRLAGATGSVAAMVLWLIADHELWERRSGRAARQGEPIGLYNAVTLITVVIGVVCLFVGLLAANLVAAGFVISPGLLESTLQHPVGVRDYVVLTWFTSSAAVIAGALGSGLESDEAVQKAAYGNRTPPTR